MYIVLTIICFIFSIAILFKDGQSRLLTFLVAITFLPYGFEVSYKLSAPRILVLAFFLSILIRRNDVLSFKKMPCAFLMLMVFVAHMLTGLLDHRLSVASGIGKALVMYGETFGGILLGYTSFKIIDNNKERKLVKVILGLSIMVSLYALFCFVIKADPFSSAIGDTDSMNDDRHRISSFFFNSHMAGFAISVFILMMLYFRQKIKFSSSQNIILILMFVSLLLTKSRSSLLDLFAGCIVLYSSFLFQSSNKMKYIGTGLIALLVVYLLVGETIMQQFSDAFKDDGGDTGGSNVSMRMQQLSFSFDLFLQNPWFGNGFNYFWDNIKAKDNYLSSMLLGAESYVFILLIERGLIQIITISVYFIWLYRYFLQHKSRESTLAMALLTAFLVNSIVTGNTYKWIFVMPFMGYYLRFVQLKIKKN